MLDKEERMILEGLEEGSLPSQMGLEERPRTEIVGKIRIRGLYPAKSRGIDDDENPVDYLSIHERIKRLLDLSKSPMHRWALTRRKTTTQLPDGGVVSWV